MSSAPVFDSAADADQPESALEPPENSFQLGFSTPTMTQNAIKYAHGNVVLGDATFGTNANKLSLYTCLAIDEFGNVSCTNILLITAQNAAALQSMACSHAKNPARV